jgi:hypothetical protein
MARKNALSVLWYNLKVVSSMAFVQTATVMTAAVALGAMMSDDGRDGVYGSMSGNG